MAMRKYNRGYLVTIDGVDGCGKSTICDELAKMLEPDMDVELYDIYYDNFDREMFNMLKKNKLTPEQETLMFSTIFQHNWDEYIKRDISSGKLVVCDRWITTTLAYQVHCMYSDIMPMCTAMKPDMQILLDVTDDIASKRIDKRGKKDKWESSSVIKKNLNDVMRKIAKKEKYLVVDVNTRPINDIVTEIYRKVIFGRNIQI